MQENKEPQPEMIDSNDAGNLQQTVVFSETAHITEPIIDAAPTVLPTRAEGNKVARSNKSGGLIAGLAIGAIVGAIAGGATSAIVASNLSTQGVTSFSTNNGQTVIETKGGVSAVSAIAMAATNSVVTIEVISNEGLGTGSGVIFSADGYIITNAHVVTDTSSTLAETQVRVFLSDGTIMPAEVVGTDPYSDIAVIKVAANNLPSITVADPGNILVGDLAVAIGAPFNLSNTVTSGVISTLHRGITIGSPLRPLEDSEDSDNEYENESSPWNFDFEIPGRQSATPVGQVTLPVIQTDADINPGNSGGALLNDRGELIGINVAIASTGSEAERAGSVGLGFAIPSELAVRVAESIIVGETPSHGLLGATVEDSLGQERSTVRGGLVRDVIRGGSADSAGIKRGDIIVSVGNVPTADGTAVSAMVRYHESGEEVVFGIQRNGEFMSIKAVLGSLT